MTVLEFVARACDIFDSHAGVDGCQFSFQLIKDFPSECPTPKQLHEWLEDKGYDLDLDTVNELFLELGRFYDHMDMVESMVDLGFRVSLVIFEREEMLPPVNNVGSPVAYSV